jgi:hypothetical protein
LHLTAQNAAQKHLISPLSSEKRKKAENFPHFDPGEIFLLCQTESLINSQIRKNTKKIVTWQLAKYCKNGKKALANGKKYDILSAAGKLATSNLPVGWAPQLRNRRW